MAALPANSPIQRLDFDVLGCIVQMNADMFYDDGALETTLATSRVCRDWRGFMLSTSVIWAHLIDLDHRLWRTVEGRHELIRRSGIILLRIKANHLHDLSLPSAKNILNIVGENWQRIQMLDITIDGKYVDQWSLLFLPAPHLEAFGITFTHEYFKFKNIFSSLFGGSAPMLRELCFSGHSSNFTARQSWLQHLVTLGLTIKLTVSETLGVLMFTERLVYLQLDHLLADRTTSTLPLVSLPNLAHLDLNLYGKLTPGAVLLDHMCIPAACSLDISARSIQLREVTNESTLAPIIRTISSYARSHTTYHAPQQLWLTITSGYFTLKTAVYHNGPTFEFSLELFSQPVFPTRTLTMLLSEFALPTLSKVTWCGFRIAGVDRPVPGFTAFMASLPSVNAIRTDKLSLRHLRAWSLPKGAGTAPRIGFPALKIIKLVSFPLSHCKGDRSKFDSVPDPVSKYIIARISRGHPISLVDFTHNILNILPDMVFLRKADGLKVLWRQRGVKETCEYICGTGAPRNPVSVQQVDSGKSQDT